MNSDRHRGTTLAPDPAIAAQVLAGSRSRTAHHEAGHAVAIVVGGATIDSVWVNRTDWTALPLDADTGKGGTTTYSDSSFEAQPFIAFAGPWAEARWTVEIDPDLDADDMDDALHWAWDDNADGDTARYEDRVSAMESVAAQLGFGSVGRVWEREWSDQLESLWPAICAVAELLTDGQTVTHDLVRAAVERCADDDDQVHQ